MLQAININIESQNKIFTVPNPQHIIVLYILPPFKPHNLQSGCCVPEQDP